MASWTPSPQHVAATVGTGVMAVPRKNKECDEDKSKQRLGYLHHFLQTPNLGKELPNYPLILIGHAAYYSKYVAETLRGNTKQMIYSMRYKFLMDYLNTKIITEGDIKNYLQIINDDAKTDAAAACYIFINIINGPLQDYFLKKLESIQSGRAGGKRKTRRKTKRRY